MFKKEEKVIDTSREIQTLEEQANICEKDVYNKRSRVSSNEQDVRY